MTPQIEKMKNHLIVLIFILFFLRDALFFHIETRVVPPRYGAMLSTGFSRPVSLRNPRNRFYAIFSGSNDVHISKLKVSDIKDIVRLYTSKKDPGPYVLSKLWIESFLKIAFPKFWRHSIYGLKITKQNGNTLQNEELLPFSHLIGMVELSLQPLNGKLLSVGQLLPFFYRCSSSVFSKTNQTSLNMQPYITNLVIHKSFRRKGLDLFLASLSFFFIFFLCFFLSVLL
jgi:hypothetical protein